MFIAWGILNIIYQLFWIMAVGLGSPPVPPAYGIEMLSSLILYVALSINIFTKNKVFCKIILVACSLLTAVVFFNFTLWNSHRQDEYASYWDVVLPVGILFLLPLIVNLIILSRPKIKERFK
jgi:hypothetical protein